MNSTNTDLVVDVEVSRYFDFQRDIMGGQETVFKRSDRVIIPITSPLLITNNPG